MMVSGVNKSTPLGCVIGTLGILASGYSVWMFWAAYKAFHLDPPKEDLGKLALEIGALTALPALLGLIFSFYRLATAGKRKHRETSQYISR